MWNKDLGHLGCLFQPVIINGVPSLSTVGMTTSTLALGEVKWTRSTAWKLGELAMRAFISHPKVETSGRVGIAATATSGPCDDARESIDRRRQGRALGNHQHVTYRVAS